ncbi:hypothetical protein PC358_04535 [Pseudomonas capeferrum]|nr:hypothetical protein PC358_04535 [Pseudomonas capeferrum]
MHARLRPAGSLAGFQNVVHEAGGAAHIQVATLIDRIENGGGIQFLLLHAAVIMESDAVRERRMSKCVDECCTVAGAEAVMKLELQAAMRKFISHGQDWGNTNASGKQQVALCAVVELEQIAWRTDRQRLALLYS